MVLDIICGIVVLWAFFIGFKKGIIHSVFFFISFILGTLISLKFSHLLSEKLATWISVDPTYLPIISFIILFSATTYAVILLANLLEKLLKMTMLNLFNRIAGAMFWILIGTFLLSTAYWYAGEYGLITQDLVDASFTYNLIAPISPLVMEKAGTVLPFFEDIYGSISDLIQLGIPA